MDQPDLVPLMGAFFVQASEEVVVMKSQDPAPAEPLISMHDPDSIQQHPVSEGEAQEVCNQFIGLGGARGYTIWTDCLPAWWSRLRSAPTPDEKLTCERMINALNRAAGMHQMERAARLAASNQQRRTAQRNQEAAARKASEEAAAIDRWR
ncbi:hypothetical protein [Paracoccus sp. (in: a-proteobacteria)]|uniref:hypothetical protein n=1 Tax=Paracoccus sp. TaxID=267 RepID=UPI00289F8A11|nr:hypothetical protein [Paracoccus sp. (in: a-proteobacteria)]